MIIVGHLVVLLGHLMIILGHLGPSYEIILGHLVIILDNLMIILTISQHLVGSRSRRDVDTS